MNCPECKNRVPGGNGTCPCCGAPLGTQATTQTIYPVVGQNALGLRTLTFNANGVLFTMVKVEQGSFYRGLSLKRLQEKISTGTDWRKDYPLVKLNDYYIGETLVTQELWEAIMHEKDNNISYWDNKKGIHNPSIFKGKKLPVEGVDAYNANDFIRKLNNATGWNFDIPTNDEWEFAARGGNLSKGYTYAGSDNINDVAWYQDNSYERSWKWTDFFPKMVKTWHTHPVKKKRPNELGLYDMSGNVDELCRRNDNYHGNCRGGNYSKSANDCETANLYSSPWWGRIGCRLVLRISNNWRLQTKR